MQTRSALPWLLEEVTLADVREHAYQLAVLPLGATEPHNLHLPYGTDSIEAFHLAGACCAAAWQMGCRLVQLPVIPYGTETNMQRFPLAMNIMPRVMMNGCGSFRRVKPQPLAMPTSKPTTKGEAITSGQG